MELLNALFSDADSLIMGIINAKIDALKDKLNDLVSFHKQLFISEQGINVIDAEESILRKKVISHIEFLIAWLKSEKSDMGPLFQEVPWLEWQNLDILSEKKLPEKIEFPYLKNFPIQNLKKPLAYCFFKGLVYKYKCRNYHKGLVLNRKDDPGRIIHMPDFINFHFTIPISEFLLEQWQNILASSITNMHKAHQASETLKDQVLLTTNLGLEEGYWESLKSHEHRQILLNYQKLVTELQQDIQNYKEQMKVDLHSFLERLSKQINSALDIAGSPLLPNSAYQYKKIV